MNKKPYMLIIRDGWGFSPDKEYNAIEASNASNHKEYLLKYPYELIHTSGLHVGLPEGNQGSSEVGHLNLGAGRVVYQNLVRISKDIANKKFLTNKSLLNAIKHSKKNNSTIHLFGLVQDQGVHAHTDHLLGYLKALKMNDINTDNVLIHVISDGRDTPPKSVHAYIDVVKDFIKKENFGTIASITGRYFAMDRDNRWERVSKFYELLTHNKAAGIFNSVHEAIEDAYQNGETDEFIKPRIIKGFQQVKDNDCIIFFNYRFDRAREIARTFIDETFKDFKTVYFKNLFFLCTTEYYEKISESKKAHVEVMYPLITLNNLMGKVISDAGLNQLRIAETEKYAHVTFFFNGQEDTVYKNEERILVPSPKVPTYDMQPEMSAYEVTDKVLTALDSGNFDFIVLNYANPDMVGHTGIMSAATKACKVVDECVGKVVEKVLELDGIVFLTSDHGNSETMVDKNTGKPHTAHTTNPVWLHIISKRTELQKNRIAIKKDGKLADISPTILYVMRVKAPKEMDGDILIQIK